VRARELGISEVHQGRWKDRGLRDHSREVRLRDDETAFIGDDIVDVGIFKRVGLAVTVADCDPAVKPFADMATKAAGGGVLSAR